MAHVTLRYWAAAKDAAGVAEQSVAADTLASALAQAGEPGRPGGAGARARAVLVPRRRDAGRAPGGRVGAAQRRRGHRGTAPVRGGIRDLRPA